MKVHIFDVDFTIVRCSTVRNFLFRGIREHLIGPSISVYAPMLYIRYALLKERIEADERVYPFLEGVSRTRLEALAHKLFEDVFKPRIIPPVASRIARALEAGERTLIASSSFGIILKPISQHFGISEIIANELEFSGEAATGRLMGRPIFGEGKRLRVLEYLKSIGAEPRDCSFYSDSSRDLPLLQEVGTAIAVNPDRRLRRTARKLRWEIIDAPIRGKDTAHA